MLGSLNFLLFYPNGVSTLLHARVQDRQTDIQRGRKTHDVSKFVRESADLLLVESRAQKCAVWVIAWKGESEEKKSRIRERHDAGELDCIPVPAQEQEQLEYEKETFRHEWLRRKI